MGSLFNILLGKVFIVANLVKQVTRMKGAYHRAEVRGRGQVDAGQPVKIILYRWGKLSIIC